MDALQNLLEDLRSSDPSIRFSVLSRIESMEWSAEQVNTFQALLLAETDPGARFHLQKLLARIDRKKGADFSDTGERIRQIEHLVRSERRDELALALLLEEVSPAEAPIVADFLRQASWQEFPREVLPFLLQFFRRFGVAADVPAIEGLCASPDPRVLAAAVETLEKLNPDSLKERIVPLLVHPSHGIRSRAVRLLYRWDPQEALQHLEAMLFSEDQRERTAALFHAFFFPFPEIEPLMLRFLSLEADPAELQRAGFLFRANPMPEEPERLYELIEAAGGTRRKVLEEIFDGVLESLSQAGLVDQTPAELRRSMQDRLSRRRSAQMVDAQEQALQSTDPGRRREAVLKLSELKHDGAAEAETALRKHQAEESQGEIRELITRSLGPAESRPETGGETSIQSMTPEARTAWLGRVDRPRLKAALPGLRELVKQKPSPEERIALIRAFGRVGEKGDAVLLQGFLGATEPEVLVTAIETFGHLDPDGLFPFLSKLIQHPADTVRMSAVRALSLFDKKQALSVVEKTIRGGQPQQRRLAISCAGQLDFPAVRELLLSILGTETDSENLGQVMSILRANLDEELLLRILRLTFTVPGQRKEALDAFIQEGARRLVGEKRVAYAGATEFLNALRSKLENERRQKSAAAPSYALNNIQNLRRQQAAASASPNQGGLSGMLDKLDPGLIGFTLIALTVGFILTLGVWFVILAPREGATPAQPVPTGAVGEFDGSARTISGTITFVEPAGQGIMVRASSGDMYYAVFKRPPGLTFVKGGPFTGKVRPYKRDDRLVILAEFLSSP